jgi:hypothetical protein
VPWGRKGEREGCREETEREGERQAQRNKQQQSLTVGLMFCAPSGSTTRVSNSSTHTTELLLTSVQAEREGLASKRGRDDREGGREGKGASE